MAETILNVYFGSKTDKLIAQADKISPNLARKIRDLGRKGIKDVADLALKAYLSKVPIDTGELRGLGFGTGYIKRSIKSTSFSIYITSDIHKGRDKKLVPATELADWLNRGYQVPGRELKRTQNSIAVSSAGLSSFGSEKKRTPTKDWEGKALRAFKNALPKYLSTLRLY